MSEPLIQTHELDAYYGDFRALFSVNLTVNPGEVVAVIGANGAGKSTLLRSIAGLLKNNEDQLHFKGLSIGALRADQVARLGIALVPEGRHLFPSLSIEENLLIGRTGGRDGHWNLKAVYDLFPILKERRHLPSTELSGGQQQMVAISRALMANPEVILFDEISLGLAPVVINDIYHALPNIINQGTTAIIVEQDISRALTVSTRFYCLQEGKIKLSGDTDTATLDDITAAYFGVAA